MLLSCKGDSNVIDPLQYENKTILQKKVCNKNQINWNKKIYYFLPNISKLTSAYHHVKQGCCTHYTNITSSLQQALRLAVHILNKVFD